MPIANDVARPFLSLTKKLLKGMLPSGRLIIKDAYDAAKGIPLKYLISDAVSVWRTSGVYIIFAALAVLAFWVLPQGRDTVYILVDKWNSSIPQFLLHLAFLVIAQILWSVATEFGSRYAIYVSDNSGKSLNTERVLYRRAIQKLVAAIYLLLPSVILLVALLIVCVPLLFTKDYDQVLLPGLIVLAVVYLTAALLSNMYFRLRPGKFWRLPFRERIYVSKLFGIYKDYSYSLPDKQNFSGTAAQAYSFFATHFSPRIQTRSDNFPQSSFLDPLSRVPVASEYRLRNGKMRKRPGFKLLPDGFKKPKNPKNQEYKWNYRIPLDFYPKLHFQLTWVAGISLALYLLVTCLGGWPLLNYSTIGAPALICLAFGCWSGIYVGILYLDYGLLRHKWFSVRMLLVLLLCLSSFTHDHPVRQIGDVRTILPKRATLQAHFQSWLKAYRENDTLLTHAYYKKAIRYDTLDHNRLKKDTLFYPIVFVCAEGGALRTGAYTSMLLSYMQDALVKMKNGTPDLRQSVYAYSTVSGGSLGVGFFNAITNMQGAGELKPISYTEMTRSFFEKDFLSPLVGRMLYGDCINNFIPWHISFFDRAVGLEQSWEAAYNGVTAGSQYNVFSNSFIKTFSKASDTVAKFPALFINTTEVEDGLQCWITNVDAAESDMPVGKSRDLFDAKLRGDINYSTAINFSTRFPLFSPSGAVYMDDKNGFHFIDGGYVENTGAATMLDILHALEPQLKPDTLRDSIRYSKLRLPAIIQYKPYVIMFRYGEQSIDKGVIKYTSRTMLSDIFKGIYETRTGRSQVAMEQLAKYITRTLKGEFIDMPLKSTGSDVPMNWALSHKSLDNLDTFIAEAWKADTNLLKIYFRDTNCKRCNPHEIGRY